MKFKKIVSALLASFTALSMTVCVNAAAEDATFCFDNDSAVSNWQTYGSVEQTGLKMEIDFDVRENGDGSLKIYENITKPLADGEKYGGVFITSDVVGLESFNGCTMQASVYFNPDAADVTEKFTLYSDGVIWLTSELSDENTGWSKVSLTVPENAANTSFGFTIPVYENYTGDVCYVDNVIIYDADGNAIANFGDSKTSAENIEVSIGTVGRVLLIILLAVLVVGIIAGIGFVVSMLLKKFI